MVQSNFERKTEKIEKSPYSLIEKEKDQNKFTSYGILKFK